MCYRNKTDRDINISLPSLILSFFILSLGYKFLDKFITLANKNKSNFKNIDEIIS